MRLLTLLLVLFSANLQAQFNTIDGKTFRRLSEFAMPTKNFGVDTVKSISITDTSRASGLLLLSKDTTAMYVYGDTMQMFTTAKKWNFTPSLPCCLPDTLDLNYINIVNCQPNRNEFLIARPNNTITTTECDTISYLYVDTIEYAVNAKYKVYTALLSQVDTFAPTALVLENTFQDSLTFVRGSDGVYYIDCDSCFTDNKTFIVMGGLGDDAGSIYLSSYRVQDNSRISIGTFFDFAGIVGPSPIDGILINTSIEIRVYK